MNLKDLYKLKKQAGEMQKKLEGETIEAENNGVKIIMNGKQEVISVEINPELSNSDQEESIKKTMNDCLKQVQQLMAKQMMAGGFGGM